MTDILQTLANGAVDFILPFLLVLSILVFVHEWGHYIIARLCGVRVLEFSIGFGPELFGRFDKNGTRWKLCAIPLGGFVKMFGDTDPASSGHDEGQVNEGNRDEAFFAKPVWQRALIVFAGPAINFIFALIILFGLYVSIGKPVIEPVASGVISGGAAEAAGILPGDQIVDINGRLIRSFADIQRQVTISLDTPLTLTLLREGERLVIDNVSPQIQTIEDRYGFQHSRGLLGIMGPGSGVRLDHIVSLDGRDVKGDVTAMLADLDGRVIRLEYRQKQAVNSVVIRVSKQNNPQLFNAEERGEFFVFSAVPKQVLSGAMPAIEAGVEAVRETGSVVTSTLEALGQMITGQRSPRELGGIVRIGAVAGDAAQTGWAAFFLFMALLSINLGLINLFPVPLLDGGHLVFYALEAVRGRPLSEKVQDYALRFGLVFLVGIMLFANVNDVVQIIF